MDRRYAGGNGGSHAGIGVGGAAAAASNRPYSVTRHVRAADHIAQVDSELLFLSADDKGRRRDTGVRLDKDAHRRFMAADPARQSDGGENTQLQYTPVVSLKPISFTSDGYQLKSVQDGRRIKMFIVVTMYAEDPEELSRTLRGICKNVAALARDKTRRSGVPAWHEVCVCIVSDGRSKAKATTLDYMRKTLNLYDGALLDHAENTQKPGTAETYTANAKAGDAGTSGEDVPYGSRRDDGDVAARSRRETRTKARLDLFFNVVGTPSWRDVAAIPNPRWRQYLRGVRGRAGSITKQFAGCDENSRDLLLRMLAFDPERRATPREILAHEYFREEEASVSAGVAERPLRGVPRDMSVGGFDRVGSAMAVDGAAETQTEEMEDADGPTTFEMEAEDDDAGDERRRFWELSEPRAALAALETAFEDADCASSSGGQNAWRAHFREWFERECERRTRSSSAAAPKGPVSADDGDGTRSFPVLGTRDGPGDAMEASFGSFEDPSVPGRLTRAFPLFFRGGEKPVAYAGTDGVGTRDDFESSPTPSLSVDFEQRYLGGAFGTTGVFGQGGVGESSARDFGALGDARSPLAGSPSNRNDRRFASLGALGHLGANRHGEWGEEDLPSAMKRLEGLSGAEAWGVTAVPPGMNQKEGDLYRSMSNQQGR